MFRQGCRAILSALDQIGLICRRIAKFLLVVMGVAMAVTILLQVLFRFSIKIPFPWSEELARYLMVWIGMMGASIAMQEGRHVGVDILVDRLHGRGQSLVRGMALVGILWFLGLMVREGIQLLLQIAEQRSPAMDIPMVFAYGAIPLGAFFMIVEGLRAFFRLLCGLDEPKVR